ncbi:MAG: 6-phosphogluconolactonase [Myxococcota bacterium]|jgi:6-phosphogluconolactonase|nr:6-phosphogluconolactonase [Myxococcota bacterium]
MLAKLPFIHIAPNPTEAAKLAAQLLAQELAKRSHARFAVAGGKSPETLYRELARIPTVDWSKVEVFLGDERFVPLQHPESNAGMLQRSLLAELPRAPRVHFPETDLPIDQAAQAYAALLDEAPLDLVLLGMGDDGHLASLFPRGLGFAPGSPSYLPTLAPSGIQQRLSLSLDAINRASTVLLFVLGAKKASTLARLLGPAEGDQSADAFQLPAALLAPSGELHWVIDAAAAARLDLAVLASGAPHV